MIKFLDSKTDRVLLCVENLEGFVLPSVGCEVSYRLRIPRANGIIQIFNLEAIVSQVSVVMENGKFDATIGFVEITHLADYSRTEFPDTYCTAITVTIP